MFNDAIGLFNDKKFEEALIVFENIVGLEPKNYIGDNFEKVTSIFRVAQYNIACCYSCLGSVEPGLEALQVAMSVGFDDFAKIRKDPSLKTLQAAEGFKKLLDKVRGRAACLMCAICGCVLTRCARVCFWCVFSVRSMMSRSSTTAPSRRSPRSSAARSEAAAAADRHTRTRHGMAHPAGGGHWGRGRGRKGDRDGNGTGTGARAGHFWV
jgi:hypothetical protein